MRKTAWMALAAITLGLSACMPAPEPVVVEAPATDAMADAMEAPAVVGVVCDASGVCAQK